MCDALRTHITALLATHSPPQLLHMLYMQTPTTTSVLFIRARDAAADVAPALVVAVDCVHARLGIASADTFFGMDCSRNLITQHFAPHQHLVPTAALAEFIVYNLTTWPTTQTCAPLLAQHPTIAAPLGWLLISAVVYVMRLLYRRVV